MHLTIGFIALECHLDRGQSAVVDSAGTNFGGTSGRIGIAPSIDTDLDLLTMTHRFEFPPDFLWGAATASYQIEGSPLADGAGPSIWHRFSHTPGLVANGDTGDVACDHYRRYRSDIALMKEIGLTAYRFSISWSRVLPAGTGRVNENGLDFYRRLVDALLEAGIKPMATLYHWDLPAALDDRGGWLNRDIAGWFADYAQILFDALDDRIAMWVTLNEPWVVTDGGYLHGQLAPGHRNLYETPIASHNLLRSHAAAVSAYRASGKKQIGIVVNLEPKYAATRSAEDLDATSRADAYMNRQYLDPIFFGEYPQEMKQLFGEAWPEFPADDFRTIRQPVDFVGINYYKRGVTKNDPRKVVERASNIHLPRSTYTTTDWEVCAEALTDILLWVDERYGKLPLYITENGAAFYDPPTPRNSRVDDPLRVDYLRDHLRAARQAMERGADLRGYFVWSLLDNFEWAQGYSKRLGIVHVDYSTQQRTPKQSAKFYADVIRTRGAVLDETANIQPAKAKGERRAASRGRKKGQ
jgi:beta-glucosidase